MTLPIKQLRVNAEMVTEDRHASRDMTQWRRDLLLELHKSLVPPAGIVPCYLTAAQVAANFTDGLGNPGTAYQWWAVCDGNNGTPDLQDRFIRHDSTGAGASGGSTTSGEASTFQTNNTVGGAGYYAYRHTHEVTPPYCELVFLMRTA